MPFKVSKSILLLFLTSTSLVPKCHAAQSNDILYSRPISISPDSAPIATFELFHGIEPADAAYEFVNDHNLTLEHRSEILKEACEFVICSRIEPVIWKKQFSLSNGSSSPEVITVQVLEGHEPSDSIFHQLTPYNSKISYTDRRLIFSELKNDGIPYTREHALVYSRPISLNEGSSSTDPPATLAFYDDGLEPIDVIAHFVTVHNAGGDDVINALAREVLPDVCRLVTCTRVAHAVWSRAINVAIEADGTDASVGDLVILAGEEPVDVIDAFVRRHGLDALYRDSILERVCVDLKGQCARTLPVVYKKDVNDANGQRVGTVQVLEGQELADAVYNFYRGVTNVKLDYNNIKKFFFDLVCGNEPRVTCTRTASIIFNQPIQVEDGNTLGRLTITDEESNGVIGAVRKFTTQHGLPEDSVATLVNYVCGDAGVVCQD
mmetsp:Transcript_12250/g.15273  ORF Transcript_12250/g.15273 Transcript_12250/m.15273 type:complete len:435 (+) Transcript_12250:115-1419(+)